MTREEVIRALGTPAEQIISGIGARAQSTEKLYYVSSDGMTLRVYLINNRVQDTKVYPYLWSLTFPSARESPE